MAYASLTLVAARTALADRLADPALVRWVAAELDGYLREALRTWNAYTASYRSRGTFQTTSQQAFYDLPTVLPALRGQTVTNRDLVTDLEYALLEPATPTTWTGTDQFDMDDLVTAITRRRDQFLRDTGAVLNEQSIGISPSPAGRVPLPSNVLAVRRAAWRSPSGLISALRRDDEWGASHYATRWPQQMRQPPLVYSIAATPPLQLQLIPPPQDTGALELLTVEAGAALAVSASTPLGVPNDWAWVIKWGALADLLGRDGLAADPARAAYCEARWQQGVQAATAAAVILDARINDQPCRVNSVSDADAFSPIWQSVSGIPRQMVTAGQNLLGCWPPPGAVAAGGDYSITIDVVANIPAPTADGDYLQIDAGTQDCLLDYAQHLASFKEGIALVQASQPLLDRFLRACGVTLKLQQAQQPARRPLVEQTSQDQRALPAQEPVEASA